MPGLRLLGVRLTHPPSNFVLAMRKGALAAPLSLSTRPSQQILGYDAV